MAFFQVIYSEKCVAALFWRWWQGWTTENFKLAWTDPKYVLRRILVQKYLNLAQKGQKKLFKNLTKKLLKDFKSILKDFRNSQKHSKGHNKFPIIHFLVIFHQKLFEMYSSSYAYVKSAPGCRYAMPFTPFVQHKVNCYKICEHIVNNKYTHSYIWQT